MVEVLLDVKRVLPRFEDYTDRLLPNLHKQLQESLVSYYTEIIDIFYNAIAFFKRRPVCMHPILLIFPAQVHKYSFPKVEVADYS